MKSKSTVQSSDSALPLHVYIANKMADAGLNNREFAEAIGYPSYNVIAMIKNGTMAFPKAKIIATAKALNIDEAFLLNKVLALRDPELAATIEKVAGQSLVTKTELGLINFIRTHLDGTDPDLMNQTELLEAMKPLLVKIRDAELDRHARTQVLLRKEDPRVGTKAERASISDSVVAPAKNAASADAADKSGLANDSKHSDTEKAPEEGE